MISHTHTDTLSLSLLVPVAGAGLRSSRRVLSIFRTQSCYSVGLASLSLLSAARNHHRHQILPTGSTETCPSLLGFTCFAPSRHRSYKGL